MKIFKSRGTSPTPEWQLVVWLMAGEDFTNTSGTLKGGPVRWSQTPSVEKGYLPLEWETSVDDADYVVWSYGTPIAWHRPAKGPVKAYWVTPDVTYTPTTSAHQSRINAALRDVKVWTG